MQENNIFLNQHDKINMNPVNNEPEKRENSRENLSAIIDNEQNEHDSTQNQTHNDNKELSEDELILKKLDMLRKLGELKQRGANLSQNYSLNSNYKHMEYEYKLHHDIRSKQNSIHWMSHMFVGTIKGLEMLNDHYNPFDFNLEGLSKKISENMDPYYDVMGEIYEKYNGPGKKMQPEYRLILMVAGAALQTQIVKFIPDSVTKATKHFKNDVDTIQNLKQKASMSSDAYRDSINKKINIEQTKRQKDLSDLEMIKKKELEFKQLKREAQNTTLKDNLILSTESPSMNMNMNRNRMQKIQNLQVENLARKQKIQELQENKANKQYNSLVMEKNRLNSILNNIESENSNNIPMSDESSVSTISVNPDIDNIMNSKNIKVRKKKRSKQSKDVISYDDITVGSSGKKQQTVITTN